VIRVVHPLYRFQDDGNDVGHDQRSDENFTGAAGSVVDRALENFEQTLLNSFDHDGLQ
jgi:hypothetical protein